jgi:hypothetical protein
MSSSKLSWITEIPKQHVEAAVAYAIKNIPDVDAWTLQKFLEYINVTGKLGSISRDELQEKMRLIRKYLPSSCRYSLLMLAELLELSPAALANYHQLSSFNLIAGSLGG